MKKKEDLNFFSINKKIYLMKIVYINDLTFDLNILRHTIPPDLFTQKQTKPITLIIVHTMNCLTLQVCNPLSLNFSDFI